MPSMKYEPGSSALSEKSGGSLGHAGALIQDRVTIGRALQHWHDAGRDGFVIHGRIIKLDDVDVPVGIGAGRNVLCDLPNVARDAGAQAGVVRSGARPPAASGDAPSGCLIIGTSATEYSFQNSEPTVWQAN